MPLLVACGARSSLGTGDGQAGGHDGGAGAGGATEGGAGAAPTGGAGGTPLCVPGEDPVVIAKGLRGPEQIAIDDTFAYFTDHEGATHAGSVLRVPLAGGEVVELVADQIAPYGIAIDATHVYWTSLLEGLVQRVPKEGGAAEALGPWQHNPWNVEARPAGVYWINRGNPNDGAVMFLGRGASEPVSLVSSLHDSNLLAVDETELWWTTDGTSGSLGKLRLASGATEFFAVVDTPRALALDASSVYYADAGSIRRSDRRTGPIEVLASPAVANALAVDEGSVYWTGLFEGVRKIAKGGGRILTLAEDDQSRDVAVDDACAYWASGAGTISRIAK
jgi:hypothetical protein